MKDSGEPQVSTSDPDSRQMIVRNNITEVAYNVQTSVDAKNNLLIDYKVTNNNDSKATGKWHKATAYRFKRYATRACKSCIVKKQCSKATYGKGIQRSEFQQYIEQNKESVDLNKALYKRRQAIVEHPYGTIKRQWGFSYIMTKTSSKRASADVGLMMTAYNLRRIINILGIDRFREYLRHIIDLYHRRTAVFDRILAHILAYLGKMEYWNLSYILSDDQLYLINKSELRESF